LWRFTESALKNRDALGWLEAQQSAVASYAAATGATDATGNR